MENKLIRMKSNLGEKSCAICEFNFGSVCAGYGTRIDNGEKTYGMSIAEAEVMFPKGCEDYGISLDAFTQQEKMNGN